MIHGLYTATWGAIASEMRHQVIANNLANVNTPGFRADWTAMTGYRNLDEVRAEVARPDRRLLWTVGGGAMVAETRTMHAAGPAQETGRSTDLAINGDEGFFAVQRGEEVRYTRAGNFRIGPRGELLTADGSWQVQGEGGGLILVGGPDFTVGRDGTVSRVREGLTEEVGRVRLVRFDRPDRLVKTGETMFQAPEDAGVRAGGAEVAVEQGFLEGSGTNAAEGMVRMIEAFRSYEFNMQLVRAHDQLLGQAASGIARLS
ncbi:MAG TPA: flagellar hook-basal body protein [Planctomycetota bacterium]|nr:flagellar hook-basal body protein [Planctomycetota bacterium]